MIAARSWYVALVFPPSLPSRGSGFGIYLQCQQTWGLRSWRKRSWATVEDGNSGLLKALESDCLELTSWPALSDQVTLG